MINVMIGKKGSGKTAWLVDKLNEHADRDGNVACIGYGHRLDSMVNHKIRLIDIKEYPTKGYRELLSFLSGILARDYDMDEIFIDSVAKVSGDDDLDHLAAFLSDLDAFCTGQEIDVVVILSADPSTVPEGIKKYAQA